MNKILLSLVLTVSGYYCYAQTNTFPFPASGNVGIGTTSPLSLFSVGSASQFQVNSVGVITASILSLQTNTIDGDGLAITNTNNSAYLRLLVNGPNAYAIPGWANSSVLESVPASTGGFVLGSYSGDILFQTNNRANRMVINSAGNVGIGTISPDTRLTVNGTIHTKEVKVDLTGWPDYVFKPAYNLPLLSDVKAYIDKNQHLPEMPSEKEVAEKGLNLGEMNKLLTKKVEELTLYLIEKDRENADLKLYLKDIESRLEQLESTHKKD